VESFQHPGPLHAPNSQLELVADHFQQRFRRHVRVRVVDEADLNILLQVPEEEMDEGRFSRARPGELSPPLSGNIGC